jgi:hypothetical protein
MTKKYTKNEHMHHLNDGAEPMDPEAQQIIKDRLARASINGQTRNTKPQHIGQWLQVTHRAIFNRDFDLFVQAHNKQKHCMS